MGYSNIKIMCYGWRVLYRLWKHDILKHKDRKGQLFDEKLQNTNKECIVVVLFINAAISSDYKKT